jgi:hypothetical protein
MQFKQWQVWFLAAASCLVLSGCVTHEESAPSPGPMASNLPGGSEYPYGPSFDESRYQSRLPSHIASTGHKTIVVDPTLFAWGAYDASGDLVKGGIATAGADYCPDEGTPCRTSVGTFHVTAMRGEDCKSHTFPIGKGGALMPYCIFFHGGESLHGSPDHMLVEQNISHGCIHIRIPDAEWLHNDFATIGTKVVIMPY